MVENSDETTCPVCSRPFASKKALSIHARHCPPRPDRKPVIRDQGAIDRRRDKVFDLRLCGMTMANIATTLGCGIGTVSEDLDAISAAVIGRLRSEDVIARVAAEIAEIERMEQRALADYLSQNAKTESSARAAMQARWKDTFETKIKLLQEFGIFKVSTP